MPEIGTSCLFCNVQLDNVTELHKHLKSVHMIRKLNCFVCDFSSKKIKHWLQHLSSQHGFEIPRLMVLANRYNNKPIETQVIKEEASADLSTCSGTFHITLAQATSDNSDNAEVNIADRDPRLTCSKCVQTFRTSIKLKKHMLKHCSICPYVASSKAALERHLCTHSKEKPFQCPLCEFRASMNSTVTVHMRTHTDERPFSCKLCDYAARTSSQLASHMLCHTGEKPFQCQECGRQFTQSGSLGRHRKNTCKMLS